VNQLIEYLRKNVILDFQGDLNLEMCREFLKDDDSREARQLLAKIVQDKGTNEMILILADCLVEAVQNALTDDVMREQLRMYSES
jgi:thioredoxin-like negative regulator of GroEL